VILGGWTVSQYHEDLAQVNFKVRLANQLMTAGTDDGATVVPDEITAFRSSGTQLEALYKEAASIVRKFYIGGWIMGAFLGLVFGLTLARLTIYRYRNEYVANKGNCFSCARCLKYCPVKEDIK
jgi:NAD-dependent dihydropyrimidine dehydrogenase PreA subunit